MIEKRANFNVSDKLAWLCLYSSGKKDILMKENKNRKRNLF